MNGDHRAADRKARDMHRRRPHAPEQLRPLMKGLAWRMDHAVRSAETIGDRPVVRLIGPHTVECH